MRVFISQPMNGKTDEEIKEKRKAIIDWVTDHAGQIAKLYHIKDSKVEIIDSFFEGAPHDELSRMQNRKSLLYSVRNSSN